MEKNENLEGKETNSLEATSASEPIEEAKVDLSNNVNPTEEEVKDAGLNVAPEQTVEETQDAEPTPAELVESETVEQQPAEQQPAEQNQVHEENGVTETPALKTFTQEEVNEIVGRTRMDTREKTFQYIYNRYGVNDEAGLDEVVGNAQRYDSLNEQYESDKKSWKNDADTKDKQLSDLSEQVALMQSGIDNSRYEDAKFILKGKGLPVTLENIKNEIATHPEWQKQENAPQGNPNFAKTGEPTVPQSTEPKTKISVLGNDSSNAPVDDEEARAMKLFKV